MVFKKFLAKSYNNVLNLLQGSGLSKFEKVRRIHSFFTHQLKSEFVDFYEFKLYLGKYDEENFSGGISYEDNYLDLLETEINRGENVVDVGAKIGVYSLAFSKFVGSTGTVFSFEPTPDSFIVLKKNIDVNQLKNIVAEQKAITDKNDVECLEINEFDGIAE